MVNNKMSLIPGFQSLEVFQNLTKRSTTSRSYVLSEQLIGSAWSFFIASLNAATNGTTVIIAEDKEKAAYLYNDLQGIKTNGSVHFLPDSFRRPMFYDVVDPANIQQRSEAVNLLSQAHPEGLILVTYPEAVFERIVNPHDLEGNRISLTKGEQFAQKDLVEFLDEFGFKREPFVYEPGQYSVRGGIIDLFGFGIEWPYRIEWFDDEIDRIRAFDPLSQLSKKNLEKISIVPDFGQQDKSYDRISLLEAIQDRKDTILVLEDADLLLDRLQQCFEKVEIYSDKIAGLENDEVKKIFTDRAFLYPREVTESIKDFSIVSKRPSTLLGNPDEIFQFSTSPQPSFNKNFSLLMKDLKEWQDKGYHLKIFAENPRQHTRFRAIFKDLDATVTFEDVTHSLHEGFINHDLKVVAYSDHQIFQRFHAYNLRTGFSKEKALNLRMLKDMHRGDYVTHIDHGVGIFSGLEKLDINGHKQEAIRLIYRNNDMLYVSINSLHKVSKYIGKDGTPPKLSKLGSDTWSKLKAKAKRKIKDIAGELIKLYAKRKNAEGIAYPEDGYLQAELEASFLYEDTPDQFKITQEVKEDMEKPYPMDRLICGDVGFGKTEIAIRAAFKAAVNGKQVAILVPTTILALQHFNTFSERLHEFGCTVDYINRFKTAKEKRETLERLAKGELDIIIGTHALLGKQVQFKNLGLLVVDEEQKFGVSAKEKLRKLMYNVDTLTLTATPIPRTLQFSLMSARDLSVMRTAPPNRQPIHTELRVFNEELVRDAIYYEVQRGGQVFFVHNRVKSLPDIVAMLQRLCPEIDFAQAHGQMGSDQLEKILVDFIDRKHDVLVSTNIIETGLDIPNANTIIINQANQFGMSDLHQLRGRVGRSNQKAFCYLLAPPISVLTTDARKRLKTIEEFADLGSGFQIAMRDLDIRGAGNLLGAEQKGFISDIGFDTYQKILDEAIKELRQSDYKELFEDDPAKMPDFVSDVIIDVDVEMLIPTEYITDTQERLYIYTEIDKLESESDITAFKEILTDRFGAIPSEVEGLFDALRLRWLTRPLGVERVVLKKNKLRYYFVADPQSPFYESALFGRILDTVTTKKTPYDLTFKKSKRHFILTSERVNSIHRAIEITQAIYNSVKPPTAVVADE